MHKSGNDTFEGINNSSLQENNFFLAEDLNFFDNPIPSSSETSRRLNDYDFNLLKEDAYKDVSDDIFKLEYKISRLEEDLRTISAQLDSASEIGDYALIDELKYRKSILDEDYRALLAIYNNKTLSGKISDRVLNLFGGKYKKEFQFLQNKFAEVSDVIISKMPKQLSAVFEIKKSLAKLENLNRSVDELISLNIPYGENINKYEQLSKYIIKANSIQAEISKYMKDK